MGRVVHLTEDEIAELDRQGLGTKGDGGFQGLLVGFRTRLDRETGELSLNDEDLKNIPRHAFDYKNGGWQRRLERIFQRELGPSLGRESGSG